MTEGAWSIQHLVTANKQLLKSLKLSCCIKKEIATHAAARQHRGCIHNTGAYEGTERLRVDKPPAPSWSSWNGVLQECIRSRQGGPCQTASRLVHGWDRIKNPNLYSLLALSTHKNVKCYPTITKKREAIATLCDGSTSQLGPRGKRQLTRLRVIFEEERNHCGSFQGA